MSVNFSNTTPAAPAGTTNVSWLADGSGNMSANVPKAATVLTANNVDLLAQAANIAATNLIASASAGIYRVTFSLMLTQAATTSSTLPSFVLTWTDNDNSTLQTVTFTATTPSANTLTTNVTGTIVLNAKAASAIQYSTTSYASVGATPMQYALHIKSEQMF